MDFAKQAFEFIISLHAPLWVAAIGAGVVKFLQISVFKTYVRNPEKK